VPRPLSLLAAVYIFMAVGRPAMAEQAPDLSEARERFDHGIELYDDGDHEAALAEFLRAYEVAPNWAVLFNIGQVQAQLRRYPEAVTTFERYLREGADGVPAARRRTVTSELRRLRRLLGRVTLTVRPAEARGAVYVDGTEVGQLPRTAPLIVGAGTHTIEVRAEGYLPVRQSVTVAGGEERSVEATLTAAGPPGGILVSVTVPYATVHVDGEEVGTTPLSEPLSASEGRHIVEVRRDGYEPAFTAVQVEQGEVARAELSLEPLAEIPEELAGRLDVRLDERAGVRFLLDGVPMPEGVVPIGPHRLEVRLEGFEPWAGEVVVERGEPTSVEVALQPTEGFRESYEASAHGIRIASYVVAGLGVAALGTAVGLLVWNDGRFNTWEAEDVELRSIYRLEADDPLRPPADVIEARQDDNNELWASVSATDIASWIMVGVGVAAAATWAGLFFGGPDPGRYSRVAIMPGPGSLTVAWAWP